MAAILAAARALLQERSPTDVTLRAVAERAGTSPASVYRYFDDLDHLLDTLVAEHARASEEAVAEALATSRHRSVAGVFELVARTFLDLYERRPELTVAWQSAALADRQQEVDATADEGLARTLGDHLHERGIIGPPTPEVEARLVSDWITAGALLGVVLRSDPDQRDARIHDLVALVRWLASRY